MTEPIKVAINGFGRIGRLVARAMFVRPEEFTVVAVHDLDPAKSLATLLKYDSVHGVLDKVVLVDGNTIIVKDYDCQPESEARRISVIGGPIGPSQVDWGTEVDAVIEATGRFTGRADLANGQDGYDGHLGRNGCRKVLLTVPAKDKIDATIVMGVNEEVLKAEHNCVSNASCTTNCLAPIAKVLNDAFTIKKGWMTTVHAYTNDQIICDGMHKDLRRARGAATSIIPTTTGAAKAIGEVLPELAGKLNGGALRVPVPDGSIVDLVIDTELPMTKDAIKAAMKAAANGPMKGILGYTEDPIVSVDIIDNSLSSLFDGEAVMVNPDGLSAKVYSWYDNEWGYSCRVCDLIALMFKLQAA